MAEKLTSDPGETWIFLALSLERNFSSQFLYRGLLLNVANDKHL